MLKHKSPVNKSLFFNRDVFVQFGLLIAIPIIAGLFATLPEGGLLCFLSGLRFYLYVAVPAIITGIGVTYYSISVLPNHSFAGWISFTVVLLFMIAVEIITFPQVYSMNPIIGLYPGVIYDELIRFGAREYIYRVLVIIYFILPIFFFNPMIKKFISTQYLQILFAVIGFTFFLSAPVIGFSTSEKQLERILSKQIVTEHFIINIPDELFNDSEINYFQKLHELSYKECKDFFKTEPDTKIHSFIFKNESQKQKLTGAGAADLSKPWLGQIYISADNYEVALKHEIAHIFTAGFGSTLLKLPRGFNTSLLEGAATAADGFIAGNDIDYFSFLILEKANADYIARLFAGFNFFSANTQKAYSLSGSFVKYMISRYGIEKFKTWYQYGYEAAGYSKSLNQNCEDYILKIKSAGFQSGKAVSRYYFGTMPFIFKKFPRYIAEQKAVIDELINKSQFLDAERSLAKIKNISNEPALLFREFYLLDTLQRYVELKEKLQSFTALNQDSPYLFSGILKLGDYYAAHNQIDSAVFTYRKLIDYSPNFEYQNSAKLRIEMAACNVLKDYLTGGKEIMIKILKQLAVEKHSTPALHQLVNLGSRGSFPYSSIKELFIQFSDTAVISPETVINFCSIALRDGDAYFAEKVISNTGIFFPIELRTKKTMLKNQIKYFLESV